ncbi:MAG: hypothetical protein PHZ02_06035 [Desulfocapsaceae bacterium]|nr:hypothetical protein [Desulfocapsaceae bacterium]
MPNAIIEGNLNTKFEKDLFRAALDNLESTSSPLAFNNFAYAIRELARHILSRIAPDEDVKKCPWYKNESGDPDILTRRERIIYAIQGGLENNYIRNTLGIDPRNTLTRFSKIIKKLNNFTHINEHTFDISAQEITQHSKETLETLTELFKLITSSWEAIVVPLKEQIDDEVFAKAIFETNPTIDTMATHHTVESVDVYAHEISKIDSKYIYIKAYGNLETELQYGSCGDLRRGDGAVMPCSFPFTCDFRSRTSNPKNIIEEDYIIVVDESSWYE